jgi:short-subunit dehydrogenase
VRGTAIEGSVCLVTGATGDIGRAAALALARAGGDVIACGRRAEHLRELGSSGLATLAFDLGDREAVAEAAAAALAVRGRVDVLVNAAGLGLHGPVAELDGASLERTVAANLIGPIVLTRALVPGMLERRRGHVVNVGSIVAHVGHRLEAAYAGTKAGLTMFSESLREELEGTGVQVSLVSPGVVDTGFFERRGASYERARPRPIPPERVGDAIVEAVRTGRAEIIVPGWLALPVRLRGAAPGLYRALARRFDRPS